VSNEVVVTLQSGVSAVQVAADFDAILLRSSAWGCIKLGPGPGRLGPALAEELAADPRVITSEQNATLEPAESRQQSWAFDDGRGSPETWTGQPASDAVRLAAAHGVSTGEGTLVAILDTGAELTHPALAGRIAGRYDAVEVDYDPSDRGDGIDNDGDGRVDEARGHGTHVAGIVALVAPDARLLIVRVLDADGRGDVWTVAAGLHWARAHGARVINLSLGMLNESSAIEYALEAAERAGATCVAAAGNWGSDTPREYPARSPHALAVGAVDDALRPAPFSSYGSFVALSAPGVAVRSAYLHHGWALWSGTSMAAPFVSGAAALLLALHPDWDRDQVERRLAESAAPLALRSELRDDYGAGVLDAGAALAPDAPSRARATVASPSLRRP